jgi:hypothetical protein
VVNFYNKDIVVLGDLFDKHYFNLFCIANKIFSIHTVLSNYSTAGRLAWGEAGG